MKQKVLITGGSGLVGSHLTRWLIGRGYSVVHVSRRPQKNEEVSVFAWNPSTQTYDPQALEGVGYIIHLAGANVAEKRWSQARKQAILASRVQGSQLVVRMAEDSGGQVKAVVSASAVGYYGLRSTAYQAAVETDIPGSDFLAQVCQQWEAALAPCPARTVVLRTGVVLANGQGALAKMAKPIAWGLGAPVGNGNQPMPWIHIHDLCRMYTFALEKNLHGPYNAVAPQACTNAAFTRAMARQLHKPLWLPAVPSWALHLALGQMATMLLHGVDVSPGKIEQAGFRFTYPQVQEALQELL